MAAALQGSQWISCLRLLQRPLFRTASALPTYNVTALLLSCVACEALIAALPHQAEQLLQLALTTSLRPSVLTYDAALTVATWRGALDLLEVGWPRHRLLAPGHGEWQGAEGRVHVLLRDQRV